MVDLLLLMIPRERILNVYPFSLNHRLFYIVVRLLAPEPAAPLLYLAFDDQRTTELLEILIQCHRTALISF